MPRTDCSKCGSPLDGSHKSYCKACFAAYMKARHVPSGNPPGHPFVNRVECRDCDALLDGTSKVYCKACSAARARASSKKHYVPHPKSARSSCVKCEGPLNGAHKSMCKACFAAYNKALREADPERYKANRRAWAAANRDKIPVYKWRSKLVGYGFTKDEANLFLSSEHRCEICRKQLVLGGKGSDGLALDHDHETGEFRGVLCNPCNLALGCFQDDPEVLLKAAYFLERFSCSHLRLVEENE